MEDNQMAYVNIPALPYRQMQMDADLTYSGASEKLHLELFVSAQRPDCPYLASGLPGYSGALLCDGPGGGVPFAEVLLTPGKAAHVQLSGTVLDQAVRSKSLYLGIRLLKGASTPSEYVKVSNIRINGRL